MATSAVRKIKKPRPIVPDRTERALALFSLILFAAAVTALLRGRAEWGEMPPIVWAHVLTVLAALLLTPLMMLRRRGDRWHRRIGWAWCIAMFATGVISFGVRGVNNGGLSWIHIFSAITVIAVPLIVIHARRHRIDSHRGTVRGLTIGGLLIAGYFTLIPDRLLGGWLLG